MKMTTVLERATIAVSFRRAWLINRACLPTWYAPISPSISSFGVSAATESMTITSILPFALRTPLSLACSPLSGWEIRRLFIFTRVSWYIPDHCMFGIYGANSAEFWASPTIWRERVVLRKIPVRYFMILRRYSADSSAMSSPIEPVGIALTSTFGESPNFIIAPSLILSEWISECLQAQPCLPFYFLSSPFSCLSYFCVNYFIIFSST